MNVFRYWKVREDASSAVATSTNTPLFSHSYSAVNPLCPILIANNFTRWRCYFKVPFVICINVLVHTLLLSKLGTIGDYLTHLAHNLSIDIVGHQLSVDRKVEVALLAYRSL
jgi:hypothetical protein